jgi:hypothetical protein
MSNNRATAILPKKDLTLLHRLQNKEQPRKRTQIANKPKIRNKPKQNLRTQQETGEVFSS